MLKGLTRKFAKRGRVYFVDSNDEIKVLECVKCTALKGKVEFPKDSKGLGGTRARCKSCCAEDYYKNRDYHIKRVRKYRQENIDVCLIRERDYGERNRERRMAYNSKWYSENKDYFQRWFRENRGSVRATKLRRRARERALPYSFTVDDYALLLREFDNRCALTGAQVSIHIDHVIPLSSGHGGTYIGNLLPISSSINTSKGARNIFEWYEVVGSRFEVLPELFDIAIRYLADLNDMTVREYREYVDACHASPNDISTEEIM